MTPEQIEARRRQLQRQLDYNRQLNKAGGVWEAGAWVCTLLGLLLVAGRHLHVADDQTLRWIGLAFLVGAFACWAVVFRRRAVWKRDHPFDPEGGA